MEIVKEYEKIICQLPNMLGKEIDHSKYEIIDRGVPHKPKSMPKGTMGIYSFWYEDKALKIGKAGPKSNPRFLSQHYNPKSAQSNLATSILKDTDMVSKGINEANVGDWIKESCRRVDILLDVELGIFTLELIEAALHYKYEPEYEGFVAQR